MEQTFAMTNKYFELCEYSNYPVNGVIFRMAYVCMHCRDFRRVFYISVDGQAKSYMYRSRVLISADPIVALLLHSLSKWQTPAQVCRRVPEFTPSSVQSTLRQLTRQGFLVREDSVAAREDEKLQESWAPWLPAGGLLHFSTKDLPYVSDLGESRRALLVRARGEPAPPELKQYPRAARVQLPAPNTKGEFPQVLLARRTWREFSERRLDLEDLSTLLWLTCGVQYWVKLPGSIGRVALKTSPSAGARHPLEVYVAALRVRGLPSGLYHYSPDEHMFELLRKGCTAQQFGSYLAGQSWYGSGTPFAPIPGSPTCFDASASRRKLV
jgi:hypothetical protein